MRVYAVQSGDNILIVLSGCGTSGRIAFQTFVSGNISSLSIIVSRIIIILIL